MPEATASKRAREDKPGETVSEEEFYEGDQPDRDRLEAAGEDLTPPAERAARTLQAPRTRAQIASEMDPQEWACRSQEHSWPQLLPNATRLPAGMRLSAAGRGNVLFEEDCLHDCGRFRETLTERGFSVVWRRYGTRPGYRHVVVHRDEAMTKAEMRQETYGSNARLIREAVRQDSARQREQARQERREARAAARDERS